MPIHVLRVRNIWSYFYGTPQPNPIKQTEFSSRQYLSNKNVHILNCLFNSIASPEHGGALSCTTVEKILVESSSFISCNTSGSYGGAIYFNNPNTGQCVLHGVCGTDCCSTRSSSSGQFAYVRVFNSFSSNNYVNYSTFTRCAAFNSSSIGTLNLGYGSIHCPSINLSMNKIAVFSGVRVMPYSDSGRVTCSLSYSSFADNNSSLYTCIHFYTEDTGCKLKCCNIIRNTQGSAHSFGTIWSNGYLMIEDSCILENTAYCIFYSFSSGSITLSNCTVDSTAHKGSFITQNKVTKKFILALDHISTHNCHSEYDSIEIRMNTSFGTIINGFASYCFLFIFNFINPNPY